MSGFFIGRTNVFQHDKILALGSLIALSPDSAGNQIVKSSYRRVVPVFALLLAGCANDPAPSEQMKLTTQAFSQAHDVGVDSSVPEYSLAKDKLERAQKAMLTEEYKKARVLAEQAELDVRLAEARVLNNKSQTHVDELNKQIARLQKRLESTP
jgi:PBP1b-binding outer membrane lipoprotein LpoB